MSGLNDRTRDSREQLRLKKLLDDFLKLACNSRCAECNSKQPRWSSTNLGVFVCIRCSGIHRNLGVHISKVKSVSLDSWTQEQVDFMRSWGNERANAYWEATLSPHLKPKETDTAYVVEKFIRDKYEYKRFAAKAGTPSATATSKAGADRDDDDDDGSDSDAERERRKRERRRKRRAERERAKAADEAPTVITTPLPKVKDQRPEGSRNIVFRPNDDELEGFDPRLYSGFKQLSVSEEPSASVSRVPGPSPTPSSSAAFDIMSTDVLGALGGSETTSTRSSWADFDSFSPSSPASPAPPQSMPAPDGPLAALLSPGAAPPANGAGAPPLPSRSNEDILSLFDQPRYPPPAALVSPPALAASFGVARPPMYPHIPTHTPLMMASPMYPTMSGYGGYPQGAAGMGTGLGAGMATMGLPFATPPAAYARPASADPFAGLGGGHCGPTQLRPTASAPVARNGNLSSPAAFDFFAPPATAGAPLNIL